MTDTTKPIVIEAWRDELTGGVQLSIGEAEGNGYRLAGREKAVCSLLEFGDLHVLGLTKDGHPRHPLYVRGDAPLTMWQEGR